MLVRDFLQPASVYGDDATVADAMVALVASRPVYIQVDAAWRAIVPNAVVGYPTSRRLIDVPHVQTRPVAAGDDIDVVLDRTQPLDVMLVEDVGAIVGCVDRRHVLDVLSAVTDPAQLGVLLLTRLTPGLLHDLANSLTVVEASLELAGRDPEAIPTGKTALRQATAVLHRARTLAAGEDDPEPRILDLAALVEQLRPLLQTATGREIDLVIDIDGAGLTTRGYRRTVERSILNLVLNARDAGPTVTAIRVSVYAASDQWLEIRIDDDGPGVPPGMAPRIFETGVSTKGAARGLGLATVAQALHRVGGTIAVAEGVLGGASFCIRLPRA